MSTTPPLLPDLTAFSAGDDSRIYDSFGAHLGADGVTFAVWAPEADFVSVKGEFNEWNDTANPLERREGGVWHGFVTGAKAGQKYKYRIGRGGMGWDKADPVGFLHEAAPGTASIITSLDYAWTDATWMKDRGAKQTLDAPISIYEMHLGSWRRVVEDANRSLGYREIAAPLVEHLKKHKFTHVEFMPLMEHPFYGSWGYEVTGYFAPAHRHGKPDDLMYLVDTLHAAGIAVIFDFVPAHFPGDAHGLVNFDGSHLYEHADPREGFHPEWNSYIPNYGRHEVRSFFVSAARFWIDRYHVDALRVDGVASMLYRDYGRNAGEWIPNKFGGRENLEAVELLKQLNTTLYLEHPGVQTMAEESTSWPLVSKPTYAGGLGFGFKWDMGWMHDTLEYLQEEPIYRRFHQNKLTFRSMYAYSEHFVLPLSHDEVVYGKGSLINKMPGDEWQKLANLRLLYSYMWAQPGKKMLFMGGELGQYKEWNHDASLDWHLAEVPGHAALGKTIERLNELYRDEKALHVKDADSGGFEWIDGSNAQQSVVVFLRRGETDKDVVLCAFNFTPQVQHAYRIGVPLSGGWREIFNSDALEYGGSGQGNLGGVEAAPLAWNGRRQSIVVTLPPLGAVYFEATGITEAEALVSDIVEGTREEADDKLP